MTRLLERAWVVSSGSVGSTHAARSGSDELRIRYKNQNLYRARAKVKQASANRPNGAVVYKTPVYDPGDELNDPGALEVVEVARASAALIKTSAGLRPSEKLEAIKLNGRRSGSLCSAPITTVNPGPSMYSLSMRTSRCFSSTIRHKVRSVEAEMPLACTTSSSRVEVPSR